MVALGLLLFALAALVTGGVVFADSADLSVTAFGYALPLLPIGAFFLMGTVTGLVGLVGLGLLSKGAARRRAARREARAARRERAELRAHNERLSQDLERERTNAGATADPYPVDGPATSKAGRGARHRR